MSYLFKLEDVLVEVVLETFVSKVDAELFEAVVFIILKSKDIEHSNRQDLRRKNKENMNKIFPHNNIISIRIFKSLDTVSLV